MLRGSGRFELPFDDVLIFGGFGCRFSGASLGGLTLDAPFTATTVDVPATRVRIDLDLIEPGDRNSSFLYLKLAGLQGAVGGNQMPQGGVPYDAVTLERIGRWIDELAR